MDISGNHIEATLKAGEKLVVWLKDETIEVIEGPAVVDTWRMFLDVAVVPSVTQVGPYEAPPTIKERLDALQALQGISDTQLNTKVVELRAG